MSLSLTAVERETIITWNDEEDLVHIHTAQKPMITQLDKNAAFTEEERIKEGNRTILLSGWLPLGSITVRNKAKGSIKRPRRKGMPTNAPRCGFLTAAGTPCKSLASKETGRCSKHKGA